MLRDRSLIPLSQQHHNGLALCVLTRRSLAADASAANIGRLAKRIVDRYELELVNHFDLEERVLFPEAVRELGPLPIVANLLADHREIERLVLAIHTAPGVPLFEQFCDLLTRHIRREENEFFQDIQQRLSRETLDRLGKIFDAEVVRICL